MNDTELESAAGFSGMLRDSTLAIPPKVAAAIGKVMEAVPKLKKGEKNTHGNFNFTSIDDFLEAVRPLCASSGLIIVQDEASFELREGVDKAGKVVRWLLITFQFTLAHISGETWGHRPKRTIMVNAAMGAQAFGAAQSYALKQFQRSLFQIATGEKGEDADSHPPGDLPADRTGGYPKKTAAKVGAKNKTELKKMAMAFSADLDACMDYDQLIALLNTAESMGFLSLYEEHMPDAYFGDGEDIIGLKDRIDGCKVDLAAAQEPRDA